MKTRIDRLGGGNTYIELKIRPDGTGFLEIYATIGPARRDGEDIAFTLNRREAYQIADTLRAMAFSVDRRLSY